MFTLPLFPLAFILAAAWPYLRLRATYLWLALLLLDPIPMVAGGFTYANMGIEARSTTTAPSPLHSPRRSDGHSPVAAAAAAAAARASVPLTRPVVAPPAQTA